MKSLQKDNLKPWSASTAPIYDIHKSYLENAYEGPFFAEEFPEREFPPEHLWKDFLGYKVASGIGVPAGPLLNARWIELAAKLGYDILTYKTIRSHAYAGHGLPNVVYIDHKEQFDAHNLPNQVPVRTLPPQHLEELAITNSFGMPSMDPQFLRTDIPKAKASLKKGQVLIVSIVGSSGDHFVEDFIATALLAKESGADAIEANFSCPNVTTGQGCVYMNPTTVFDISSKLVKALKDTPLILKVGLFPSNEVMQKTFIEAARAGVKAINGINTLSMKVVNSEGRPALGESRLTSGICGSPIRRAALNFVQQATAINKKEKLDLTLIGVGGIVYPEHFTEFFNAGADVAMTATGMMWDPYLTLRYHNKEFNNEAKA